MTFDTGSARGPSGAPTPCGSCVRWGWTSRPKARRRRPCPEAELRGKLSRMVQTAGEKVRVLTVTVSDHRRRHADETGKRLDAELSMAGFNVVRHVVLADDPVLIREVVSCASTDSEADAVVLSGGTGITPRDQTFEALDKLYEKKNRRVR